VFPSKCEMLVTFPNYIINEEIYVCQCSKIPLIILTRLNKMDKIYSHTKEERVTYQD
jgi:hypothetical protein